CTRPAASPSACSVWWPRRPASSTRPSRKKGPSRPIQGPVVRMPEGCRRAHIARARREGMTSAAVRRLREAPLHYEAGPDAASWLAEAPPEPLTEAELSRIWAGQRYPHGALTLADGRSLRVLNPGRPGVGSGPDFLDAVLQIDGKTLRGDVELHVRGSWFQAHGHDTDPAYDGVVLHVVFRADDGVATRLHNGSLAPVAAFAPWFDNRRDELQRWLGAEALWQEPCQRAVWQLGEEYVRQRLRDAGLRRFDARVEALRQT